jgi:hypothetical protein
MTPSAGGSRTVPFVLDSRGSRSPGYQARTCSLSGEAASILLQPPGYSLWCVVADLASGASLAWGADHGDEVLFVSAGELVCEGQELGAGDVLIIEAAYATSASTPTSASLVHFGPEDPSAPTSGAFGPALEQGRGIHVIPSRGRHAGRWDLPNGEMSTRFFADSTCPTCRATLMRNRVTTAFNVASHVHGQDEIIFLLHGDASVGAQRLEPGMAVAIPGGLRYGLRTRAGFDFLNYRRDVSTYVGHPGAVPRLETAEAVGLVPA